MARIGGTARDRSFPPPCGSPDRPAHDERPVFFVAVPPWGGTLAGGPARTSSASRAPTTTTLPTVTTGGRVPILSWAHPLEGSALDQARNLANLPFAIDHVALMPDAHTGYGMPIGGVLFADKAVVPYAIGVDIGCGVALAETDLTVRLGPRLPLTLSRPA